MLRVMSSNVMCACVHVRKCLRVCMYVCLSVCLYVCLYVCLSVCLPVCLSVRLSLSGLETRLHACMHVCVQKYARKQHRAPRSHRQRAQTFSQFSHSKAPPGQKNRNTTWRYTRGSCILRQPLGQTHVSMNTGIRINGACSHAVQAFSSSLSVKMLWLYMFFEHLHYLSVSLRAQKTARSYYSMMLHLRLYVRRTKVCETDKKIS